jgi:hypothetical protein
VVEEELGRGTMGLVCRAFDPDLGRTVALKTVQLAFAASPEEQESFEKRFLLEARAAGRLSHPGIVVVHDAGRDASSGALYIAFEHLRGRTLNEVVEEGPPLDWRTAVRLVARLARALHHAHGMGVVHRDIKPANVMVLDSGEPKIMDFGIAKLPAERLTATGQFFGTPSYMSPEQASGAPVEGRSDLFSLGAVLYLLLTGRTAFLADSVAATLNMVLHRDPPKPSTLVPSLPPALDRVVARALAKWPDDRYPDGESLARDVEEVLEGREPLGVRGRALADETRVSRPPLPPPEPGARRDRILLGGLGLGLLVLLLAAAGLRLAGVGASAEVELNFEHPLRSGVVRVFVDDDLALKEPLESAVKEDLVLLKVRRGRVRKVFSVRPGERRLRLEVEGDSYDGSRTVEGRFEGGETRRLEARLGGLLKKELSLWLAPRPPAEESAR